MKFDKRVKQIASAEKDVDKVLRAARLQRNPTDTRKLELILNAALTMLAMVLVTAVIVFPMVMMVLARG